MAPKHLLTLLACGMLFVAPPVAARELAAARAEFKAAERKLAPHFNFYYLDDDAQAAALLQRIWTIAGEWAADFLNDHP